MLAALVSTTVTLCVSPPFLCVWRLLPSSWFSSASFVLRSLNSVLYLIFFFFLVSFLWFWVSLSSFLLLSPLLETSLLFFLLSVRSLLGAVAVTPPKKKKKPLPTLIKGKEPLWILGVVFNVLSHLYDFCCGSDRM